MDQKLHLLGMTLAEITESVMELKLPQFTSKQIADWVYLKRVRSIDEMSNISLKNREILNESFDVGRSAPLDVKTSADGTMKMLFKTDSGKFIETVTIPEFDRLTICVSCIPMAIGGWLSAIYQGRVAASAINVVAKKPDDWAKGIILCGIVEFYAILSLLASVLLFGVTRLFRQSEKVSAKDLRYLMLVAFCEPFMYFIGEANGMQYVSPTLGSLIISTIPLVSALGAWIFLKERIYPLLIVGLLVSFSGVALLSFAEPDLHGTLKGVLLLMVAVFSGMFYGITVRRMTLKYRSLTIVTWQNFFGMLYMLPLFRYFDLGHFLTVRHSAVGLLTIAAMSVFASVGAFLLYTGVIRELGLIRSNVFTNLIPVFTVFLAFFILGERLSLRGAAGVTLTVLGLLISQSHDLRQLRRKSLSKNLSQSGM